MPVRAANPLTPFNYEPDGAEGPSFRLRGLSPLEIFDVHAGSEVDVAGGQVRWTARAVRTALRAGLLGWERFEDEAGQPVEFVGGMDKNIERLGFQLTTDIFSRVMTASSLGEDQRKN